VVKTSVSQAVAAKARAELRNRNDRLADKIAGAEEALEPHRFPPSELLRGLYAASVREYAAGDVEQFVERKVVLARVRQCDKWPYIKSRSCRTFQDLRLFTRLLGISARRATWRSNEAAYEDVS
jgi:hypothetical protein